MTPEEIIIAMAREACAPNQTFNSDEEWVKRFAALVAANEKKFWMEQIDVECNEAVLAERDRMCKQFNIPMELANETAASNEAD